MKTLIFVLLFTLIAHAEEPTPFRWPAHAEIPQRISDGAVLANLSLDAWRSLVKTDSRTRWDYACRMGLTFGIEEIAKRLIHRERPDHSDSFSMPSGHTAFASTAAHSPFTASLAVAVGWGRVSGGKHYQTDVAVGAGIGLLARKVCQ